MNKLDATLAAAAVIGSMLLASPDAKAAPKWCDTQTYVTACAIGHGGTTYYPPKKKKDCDHEGAGSESGSKGGSLS